jgi:4-amino-4-deoxy-L-arabinose transferase-like glycosyltransferase
MTTALPVRLARTTTRVGVWLATHDHLLARLESGLVIATPLLFLLLALIKAYPFVDDIPLLTGPKGELLPAGGDDWYTYKIHAIKILNEGLAEPSFGSYVRTVHGFLYNYFVAAIFAIAGVNTSIVYVVQTFLIGGSVSLLYLTVRLIRGRLPPIAAIALIVTAAAQLLIDYYRSLSFLLLSESLFLFLVSVTFFLYAWAYQQHGQAAAFVAGIALGLTVLSRTSALTAALGVIAVGFLYARADRRAAPLALSALLVAGFLLAMSLLPLREYAATGQPSLALITDPGGIDPPPSQLSEWPGHYASRLLYVFGFPQWLAVYDPAISVYRPRLYWSVIWIGVLAYIVSRFLWRRLPDIREGAMLVFLVLFISAHTFLSVPQNYGGRYISVGLPLAAVFGALFLAELLSHGNRDRRAPAVPGP